MVAVMSILALHNQAAPPSRWRLTESVLIEERPDGVRLWGRWDVEFGCWTGDGKPVIPEGQLLGRLGVWCEPLGERDDDWYGARAVVAAFWSLIPTPIRLLASRAGTNQWEALLQLWAQYHPSKEGPHLRA